MKLLTTRLRSLVALWLAAVMLVTLFAFSASAKSMQSVYFYLGNETITADTNTYDIQSSDILDTEVDFDLPLNENDSMDVILEGKGGDLAGWTVWREIGSGHLSEKNMSLAADVKLGTLTQQQLQDAYNVSYTVDWDELLFVPDIDLKYWFTRQPTKEYPGVETNKPADSYQWYKAEFADFELVDADVSNPTPSQTVVDHLYDGSYNKATGVWDSDDNHTGSHLIDAEITMGQGDTLTITVSDNFDGKVVEYSNFDVFTKNGNVYTYTHTGSTTEFNFYLADATVPFTATIYLNKLTDFKPVQGQTNKVYTGDGLALCKASFENGKYVISSDTVLPDDYYITQQPSSEDPTVKVNKPAEVKSYQWYSVKDIIGKHIFSPDNTEEDVKIEVKAIPTVAEMLDFLQQFSSEEEIFTSGQFFIAGEYRGKGVWAPILDDPQNPNNPSRSALSALDALGGGKLTVDLQVSDALQAEIDSDNNLSLEDVYDLEIVALSKKDFGGNSYPAPAVPDADGVYTIPENADYIMIRFSTDKDGLTFKPVFDTTTFELTAVEGQTNATFDGDAGKYLVKATMKDDTVLTSDMVIVPEEIVKTGDTTPYALWLTVFALSGVAFVFSVSKLRKA